MCAFTGGRLLTPEGLLSGHALLVGCGRIEAIVPETEVPLHAVPEPLGGNLLAPGFIDVQVNGGGGILFNDQPTIEGIAAISRAHRAYGTTGFLPTLISDGLDVMDRAMRAVEQAVEAGTPGVLGIHLEGPYLAPARRGVHDATKFRTLDEAGLNLLTSLRHGVTLVTLAPEAASPTMIRRLVNAGVIVSLGHTDADYDTARAAFAAGATSVTHLFNAMSPLTSRAPGLVGAALESQAWCGIIADGHHVHPAVLSLALRTRSPGRFVLVTDAMPSVGATPKDFTLQGKHITVRDGICRDPSGTLAGSDLDMATAVRNTVSMLGASLETALAMASQTPSSLLRTNTTRGSLAAGQAADFVLLGSELQVLETWIAGSRQALLF